MHFLKLSNYFALLAIPLGINAAAIDGTRAASSNQFALRVQGQAPGLEANGHLLYAAATKDNDGYYLAVGKKNGDGAVAFTLSGGTLHIPTGTDQMNLPYTPYGEFLEFAYAKGGNNNLVFNETDHRLTFKQTQSGVPGENAWRLCPAPKTLPSGVKKVVSLGDTTTSAKCDPIYLKRVPN